MQEKTTNIEMTSMEASSSSTTRPQERPSGDSDVGQKKNGSGPSSRLIRSRSSPSHFGEFSTSHLSAFTNTGPGTVLPNEADCGDRRIHGNQQEPYDGIQEEVLLDDDYSRIHRNQQEPHDEIQEEVLPADDYSSIHRNQQEPYDGIQEHVLFDDDSDEEGFPRQSYLVPCVLGSVSLLLGLIFTLTLIIVIQRQNPEIIMKSITFDRYTVSMGSDSSGPETYMASVNSTVKFTFRNTATFFGVHVTSITLKLNYLLLTLANGTTEYFYQSKKSQRTVAVVVSGNQIPMYASGASFINYVGTLTPVPLKLSFAVSSRAYILGSLVEPHFDRTIYCLVIFDPKKLKVPLSLHNCI